ncbi:NYN domain-containing protein [candidate division KSB1 bacterium]|nr:NYN domain-containing protein [candidate division KSB1 bacterium]
MLDRPLYIIDGYNFILRLLPIDPSQEHALWDAREKLVHQMIVYLGQKNISIHIVFDGQDVKGIAQSRYPAGIKVQFSNAPEKADASIINLVQKSKSRNITVVTSDKPLANSCASYGCTIMSVETFANKMAQDHVESESSSKCDEQMTLEELEEWMRLFEED